MTTTRETHSSYTQRAEQAFFVALMTGFLVMAGTFMTQLLTPQTQTEVLCVSGKPAPAQSGQASTAHHPC
jgi:hypothetical protein